MMRTAKRDQLARSLIRQGAVPAYASHSIC
jgi:hypothetical protein